MKTTTYLICIVIFTIASFQSKAQFDLKSKLKQKTEEKTDESVDKALDKVFNANENNQDEEVGGEVESTIEENALEEADGNQSRDIKAYSKYDFVPGDVVIFEDDLENEENGEFPSKWDLHEGTAEVARADGESVLNFPAEGGVIVPLMKKEGDYLPDQFTIELDAFFSEFATTYLVYLWDLTKGDPSDETLTEIVLKPNDASYNTYGNSLSIPNEDYPFWRHIAISFNVRALKVYLDETRVINIPNFKSNPTGVSIKGYSYHYSSGYQAFIKNIKIAEGAKKLYDRFITDGKIVTTGIKFDSGKSTLKPESMGVINEIKKLMEEHPDVNFSIEGHTDLDGDDASNQVLSGARANVVKETLVSMGVSEKRLKTKGWGESKPVADNSTPEGKANNRRVEFVKF